MRRVPRRVGAALAVVIAIAAVIGIVLAVDSPSPSGGATNGSQSSDATTVQRRNLVETDTESGTLSYANAQTVYNRLSGTITWLPSVGQVIKPGGTLYKVGGEPVILLNGSTPAYRDLSAADSAGPDILELNRNLVRLGFNPDGIVVDDVWQPATTDAVEVFQESLGETATGILTLGQVVFLPGKQVVSTLETSVGSTGGGSGSPSSAADLSPTGSSPEFVSLTTTTPTKTPQTGQSGSKAHHHKKSGHPTTLSALLALLRAETQALKAAQAQLRATQGANHGNGNSPGSSGKGGNKPKSSGSGSPKPASSGGGSSPSSGSGGGGGSPSGASGSGGSGGSATAILQTSSTQLVATVDLDASKQSEAKVGEKVMVEMPAGNTVSGTITAVSSVATTSSSSDNGNGNGGGNGGGGNGNGGNGSSTPTIPVTISLRGHIGGAGLDQAAVSVEFAQAKANNVLSVPVTALLAMSGGRYGVQSAAAPHKVIPVITGLFAAGFVQISGSGIYPGLQVTDSQG